ncbi:hypothetical protein [Cellulosilyticum ruminicola]|nr:hypothetical protein [Cellulosilyticum ruminicola]
MVLKLAFLETLFRTLRECEYSDHQIDDEDNAFEVMDEIIL